MPASAKLGETLPQLVKRFGKSYTIESDAAGKRYRFRSEKVSVDVLVSNDVSVAETYFSDHPLTASGEPPNDIVRAVLNTNVPQTRWSEIDAWTVAADYALRSSDQKHIAFLRYRGPQPEGSIWTLTVGDSKVLSTRFSTSAPSPLAPATTTPTETIISSATQTARTAHTSEPIATPKSGPRAGETKEQYEQRLLTEYHAKAAVTKAPAPNATPADTDKIKTWVEAAAKRGEEWSKQSPEQDIPSPSWVYSQGEDPMGRGQYKIAQVESLNTINFSFPYQGAQHASFKLQKGGRGGPSAWLQLEHANFISSAPIYARFDGGEPQRFSVAQTSDYKTDRVGFDGEGYNRFMKQLRRARKLRIEATFYQQGTRVFEFEVHGLDKNW